MKMKIVPPSRANKKQIAAHLAPELAEAMKIYCNKNDFTFQEIIAISINDRISQLSDQSRGPLLQVSRQRLFRRKKSPAKIQVSGPDCRTGTKRIAAFFHSKDVDRVRSFAKEYGVSLEHLVRDGIAGVVGYKTANHS